MFKLLSDVLVHSGVAASVLLGSLAFAAQGDLDTTFATGGVFQSPFGTQMPPAVGGVIVQPDGRIILAGYGNPGSSGNYQAMLMRLNANGTLDPSFDTDGFMTPSVSSNPVEVSDIKALADGGFFVTGTVGTTGSNSMFVAKFTAAGATDSTFNGGGPSFFNNVTRCYARDSVIQSDGKVVVAGIIYSGNSPRTAITRLTSTGSIDSNFHETGSYIDMMGTDSVFNGVAMSGTLAVAVGYSYNGSNSDILVARFTATGELDTSFDSDGIVTLNLGSPEEASSVAVLANGKILVAGTSYNGNNNDFMVARFNVNGSLDTTFGTNGIRSVDIAGGWDYPVGIRIQPDGRIVVAGSGNNGTNNDFAIVRLGADGAPDEAFGTGGVVLVPIGESWDSGYALALQNDGNIVVAGTVQVASVSEMGMIRVVGADPVVVVPTRKPDVRIGAQTSLPTGNNVYNLSGAGQIESLQPVEGGTKALLIGVQNDGSEADSFKFKGTAGNKYFNVVYKKGSTDVTAKVTAGTYRTASLKPNEIEILKVTIKAKTAANGKSLALKQLATSVAKPTAVDAAVIKVKGKKKASAPAPF